MIGTTRRLSAREIVPEGRSVRASEVFRVRHYEAKVVYFELLRSAIVVTDWDKDGGLGTSGKVFEAARILCERLDIDSALFPKPTTIAPRVTGGLTIYWFIKDGIEASIDIDSDDAPYLVFAKEKDGRIIKNDEFVSADEVLRILKGEIFHD